MARPNPTEAEYRQMVQNVDKVRGGLTGRMKSGVVIPRSTLPTGVSAPSPHTKRRSKLEDRYADHLDMLVKLGEIRRWEYEPMSLKLADGKRYRPDFLVVLPFSKENKSELHEVKGKWTKNRRDGLTHLKWAAQRYGDVFTFRLIEWTGSGFSGSYVVV